MVAVPDAFVLIIGNLYRFFIAGVEPEIILDSIRNVPALIYRNVFSFAGPYFGSLLFAVSFMLLCWLVGYFLDHPLRRDRYIDAAEFRVVRHALLMRHRLVVVVAMSLIDRLERGLHLGTGFDNNLHKDMRRW